MADYLKNVCLRNALEWLDNIGVVKEHREVCATLKFDKTTFSKFLGHKRELTPGFIYDFEAAFLTKEATGASEDYKLSDFLFAVKKDGPGKPDPSEIQSYLVTKVLEQGIRIELLTERLEKVEKLLQKPTKK